MNHETLSSEDFASRLLLWSTSTDPIEEVKFGYEKIVVKNEGEKIEVPWNFSGVEQIFKLTSIKTLAFQCDRPTNISAKNMFWKNNMHVQVLHLSAARKNDLQLAHRCEGLRSLYVFFCKAESVRLCGPVGLDEIAGVNYAYIYNVAVVEPDFLINLIRRWIQNDKNVGADILIEFSSPLLVSEIAGLSNKLRDEFGNEESIPLEETKTIKLMLNKRELSLKVKRNY